MIKWSIGETTICLKRIRLKWSENQLFGLRISWSSEIRAMPCHVSMITSRSVIVQLKWLKEGSLGHHMSNVFLSM